jgi:TPR repeat protein
MWADAREVAAVTDGGALPCPFCGAAVPAAAGACPACGRDLLVCGRYRQRELLGRGGTSLVYGATMIAVAAHADADTLPRLRGRLDVGARLAHLDPACRRVLLRLVEPDPEARYAGARDALADLRDLAGATVAARAPVSTGLLCGVLVLVLAVGLFALDLEHGTAANHFIDRRPAPPTPSARLERDCDGGKAEACLALGLRYGGGNGVEVDPTRSAALFERACGRGLGVACRDLGLAYREGRGVKRDEARAASLWRRLCDGGNVESCGLLGNAAATRTSAMQRQP